MEKVVHLEDKRKVIGEIIICGTGCCCGHTELGAPPVPVDWIMAEWKSRKLLVGVDISISGCLGPCLTNTVCIITPTGSVWLGELEEHHYATLIDWATESSVADRLLPLPDVLQQHEFERFRNREVAPTPLGAGEVVAEKGDCCATSQDKQEEAS